MILDKFSLAAKTAVITGGARGIGRGIAVAFAEAGADLAILDTNIDGAEKTAGIIRQMGRRALAIACDISDRAQVQTSAARLRSDLGRIDILVNNAAADRSLPLMDTDDPAFEFDLKVTLRGTFLCSQTFGRMMYEQRAGAILNISSRQSLTPSLGQGVYGMAKAAVNSLTRTLAWELAPCVRVNAILPGPVETEGTRRLIPRAYYEKIREITPLQRWGTPEDIAATALLLASDAGSWITGRLFEVDGGIEFTCTVARDPNLYSGR